MSLEAKYDLKRVIFTQYVIVLKLPRLKDEKGG